MGCVSASLLPGAPAWAEECPALPVELILSAAAGGGTDGVARAFGEAARTHFGQPIVVVNRLGAASSIGFTYVAMAKKDGYKMGIMSVNLAILPTLNLTMVVVEDYTFIARLNNDPSATTVGVDAPWKTIDQFIAAARQSHDQIRVGKAGTGDAWYVAALALEDKTGATFVHVPFEGGNPAVLSLLGGHLDAVTVSPGEVAQHVAAGKLRVLAVMADERMPGMFANVPTLKERGNSCDRRCLAGIGGTEGNTGRRGAEAACHGTHSRSRSRASFSGNVGAQQSRHIPMPRVTCFFGRSWPTGRCSRASWPKSMSSDDARTAMNNPSATLRSLIASGRIVVVHGAPDALTARLVQRAGFSAVYMTGFGATASRLGMRDIGLMTQTEMTTHGIQRRPVCGHCAIYGRESSGERANRAAANRHAEGTQRPEAV